MGRGPEGPRRRHRGGIIRSALLTGAVGTGKTSLAIEMAKSVRDRGGRVAVIDLDWLAWFEAPSTAPGDLDDLLYDNLRAVWANFTVRGATHAILTRFVHEPRQLSSMRGILQGVELAVGRVVAPPELVEQRLRRRDVGLELQEHLGEVSRMNDLLERERIWDVEIVNDDRDIGEVAHEAVERFGWTVG